MDTLPKKFGKKEMALFCGEQYFRMVRQHLLTDEVLAELKIPIVQFETWKTIPFKYRERLREYLEKAKKGETT